jgi:hypothetical protein
MLKTLEASDLGIVNRLLAVNLRINIWSARKKLRPQDLGDAELPPDELASLGSKKICDPAALTVFNTLKSRAIGVLDYYGLQFLGGWAIPEDKAVEVHQRLDAIELEFNEAKEDFLYNYNQNVQDWINRQREWSAIIEDSIESVDYVRSRIGFQSRFYSVSMPGMTADGADVLTKGFQEEVAGFGRALFDDVAQAATETWKNSFKGQDRISHKALSPIRKIHDKLVSFSFVDPNVLPLTEIIKVALDSLPKRGYIEGLPLIQFQGLVSLLRDTEALIDLAERRMGGLAAEDILAGFIPAGMVQSEEPEQELFVETGDLQLAPSADDMFQGMPSVWEQQSCAAPVHQAQTPMTRYDQSSLLDYSQTGFSESVSQQTPDLSSTSANVPATTITIMANEPATQSEKDQGDTEPRIAYVQSDSVIPPIQGGMGDFFDGFI